LLDAIQHFGRSLSEGVIGSASSITA
jgi:hypothetical protein